MHVIVVLLFAWPAAFLLVLQPDRRPDGLVVLGVVQVIITLTATTIVVILILVAIILFMMFKKLISYPTPAHTRKTTTPTKQIFTKLLWMGVGL